MEISPKENMILQVRGLRNCSPGEDVSLFIKVFERKLKKQKSKGRISVPA
jgi:hypothetical protein